MHEIEPAKMMGDPTDPLSLVKYNQRFMDGLEEYRNELLHYFDLNGWMNILNYYALLCIKNVELRLFTVILNEEKPALQNVVFLRKVLIVIKHIREKTDEQEFKLIYFFASNDNNNLKVGKKALRTFKQKAENLASSPSFTPTFYQENVGNDFLQYLMSDRPPQVNIGTFINLLQEYLASTADLMELIQRTYIENILALQSHLDKLKKSG
ncbi:hypothetical protein [Pedobacter suwonensis]|uniref:hypothetical protein n=1 Tax=Pedobacter suwonensis TaxID=332999 RepID=UPI0036AA53A2